MLIGSWRANSLFVLRLRAVYFLPFGLLLNYRFVFRSYIISPKKTGVPQNPRLLTPESHPGTRRPSRTSADLPGELHQGGADVELTAAPHEPANQ